MHLGMFCCRCYAGFVVTCGTTSLSGGAACATFAKLFHCCSVSRCLKGGCEIAWFFTVALC